MNSIIFIRFVINQITVKQSMKVPIFLSQSLSPLIEMYTKFQPWTRVVEALLLQIAGLLSDRYNH